MIKRLIERLKRRFRRVEVGQEWYFKSTNPFEEKTLNHIKTITGVRNGYLRYDMAFDSGLKVKGRTCSLSGFKAAHVNVTGLMRSSWYAEELATDDIESHRCHTNAYGES